MHYTNENDSMGTVSLLIGFIAGAWNLIHGSQEMANVFGSLLITVAFACASYVGQKSGNLLWKYKIEKWLKKILKIK